MINIKHQQAIYQQRLSNMKIGLEQAETYLCGLHRMLNENENTEDIIKEVEEIQVFIHWVKEQ